MATIDLPSGVGVNVLGIRPVQPQIVQDSGFTGGLTALNTSQLWWAGSVELIDLDGYRDAVSKLLLFVARLRGAANSFELPLPERTCPWAGRSTDANGVVSSQSGAIVNVANVPSTAAEGTFVRIGDRLHVLADATSNTIEIVPEIAHPAGTAVRWSRHSVRAVMIGDPSNFGWESDEPDFASTVTMDWREKVGGS